MQQLALENRHYGHRRLAVLRRRGGRSVGRHRLLHLLREDNLPCLHHRAFVLVTTDSGHSWRVYPNVTRGMQPTGPNQLWVAKRTFGWLGLSRRLSKNDERLPETSDAWIYAAMSRLMLRRLTRQTAPWPRAKAA